MVKKTTIEMHHQFESYHHESSQLPAMVCHGHQASSAVNPSGAQWCPVVPSRLETTETSDRGDHFSDLAGRPRASQG